MSSSRLVRGAKTRMFAFVCLICVLGALVYLFHGNQTKLADLQKAASSCNQQQESLSAQLQVIFEYKLRLEKSLKKEKSDHQATKETCEKREKEEKEVREREVLESTNKYDALAQQCKLQKSQYEDSKEELEKKINLLQEEKSRLESALQAAKDEVANLKKEKEDAIENLKTDLTHYQEETKKMKDENEELQSKILPADERGKVIEKQNSELREELRLAKKELKDCKAGDKKVEKLKPLARPDDNTQSLEAPKVVFSHSSNGSTTPGVNPEAVQEHEHLSSVKPFGKSSEKKIHENVLAVPNKSTQESVAAPPLVMPAEKEKQRLDSLGGQPIGQIPGPPDNNIQRNIPPPPPPDSMMEDHAGEIHDNLGPMNPVADSAFQGWNNRQDRNNAEEEEEAEPPNFRLRENPEIHRPVKAQGEGYHEGDYDREQPEEEEDDEGEQIDYQQGGHHKENHLKPPLHLRHIESPIENGKGIMVNPK